MKKNKNDKKDNLMPEKGRMINKKIVLDATLQSLVKFNPKTQVKNPVMFIVYIGAIFTMILFFLSLGGIRDGQGGPWYIFAVSLILWFTSLFGNFAEAIAEGRAGRRRKALKKPAATSSRENSLRPIPKRNMWKSKATNSSPATSCW